MELIRRLHDPRCKLVISHSSGDEGDAYAVRMLYSLPPWPSRRAASGGARLGVKGLKIINPLFSLVLTAIAVKIMANGLRELISILSS